MAVSAFLFGISKSGPYRPINTDLEEVFRDRTCRKYVTTQFS